METIIGLLMILLPVVFKLIGKRLEQAGKNQPPVTVVEETPVENWEQTLKEYMEQTTVVGAEPAEVKTIVPEPMSKDPVEVHEATRPKVQRQQKTVKKAPILLEEEKRQKEKIDVKKLIVYSEIMKSKYAE